MAPPRIQGGPKIPVSTKIADTIESQVRQAETAQGGGAIAVPGTVIADTIRREVDEFALRGGKRLKADDVRKLAAAVADKLVGRLDQLASAGEAKVAQTIMKYNLLQLSSPDEVAALAKSAFGDAQYAIATAGYSDPKLSEAANYTARMTPYFDNIGKMLRELAYSSSPTATGGSIDALTTVAAQSQNKPILYQTAAGYLPYIVIDSFPEAVDRQKFIEAPKFFYATGDAYSKGMAIGSNNLNWSGGGDVAVKDFFNQLVEGHPVVIVRDGRGPEWNDKKMRPDNSSDWMAELIGSFLAGKPLDERLFTKEKGALSLPGQTGAYQPGDFLKFMEANRSFFEKKVRIVDLPTPDHARGAADDTVQHLKREIAGVRFFGQSHVNLDLGAQVVSNAQKFIIPVPAFQGRAPVDNTGKQIVDYQGKPRTGEGFVWYNAIDKAAQFVPTDGTGVIIMNEITEEIGKKIQAKIAELTGVPGGDPSKLKAPDLEKLMNYVINDLGQKDCYDSSNTFIDSKMHAMETSKTGVPRFGLHRRDDRDICQVVFVRGTGEFAGPAFTPQQFDDGAIILRQGEKMRLIQPDVFFRTYSQVNGEPLTRTDVPDQTPRGLA